MHIGADVKKIAIAIALVSVCGGAAKASYLPGTPQDVQEEGLNPDYPLTFTLYDDQLTPTIGDYGPYSTYTLSLGLQVVNGYVIVLESGSSPDPYGANWSDVLHFSEGDTYATLTSYDGSDPVGFWATYTFTPDDPIVSIQETGGPYTIYTVANDALDSITYKIDSVVVPEPTTMIAGVLLLLPFGAATLRKLRKTRAA